MQINGEEKERRSVGMQVTQCPAAIHVSHDVLNARERHVGVRSVMHRENDARHNLEREAEGHDDAPDPHPIQILRSGNHQRVVDDRHYRQP